MPYTVRVAVEHLQELSICSDPWGRFESINAKMNCGQFSFYVLAYGLYGKTNTLCHFLLLHSMCKIMQERSFHLEMQDRKVQ